MARECSFHANKSLLSIVGALPPPQAALPHELEALLEEGISRRGELTILAALERRCSSIEHVMLDSTGIECFINHIHIDEYIPANNPIRLFSVGWQMGLALKEKLPLDRSYVIALSISEADYDDALWVCSWRFHALRSGESWLHDDLDSYANEGVLRCIIGRI